MTCQKLGLGTVQFGMDYGVFNQCRHVPPEEVARILIKASESGVTLLDTAATYGNSEEVLGQVIPSESTFQIVTKTPPVPETQITQEHGKALISTLRASHKRLKQKTVYGLLAHRVADLLKPGGKYLLEALQKCKADKLVTKIGVSVYTSKDIDAILEIFTPDIVQLPINVADQHLIRSGYLKELKKRGVEIHARSIFMQGLLLMEPEVVPDYFTPVKPRFNTLKRTFAEHGWSPLQGCLQFGLSLPELDAIIVGVTNIKELEEILAVARMPPATHHFDFQPLAIEEEKFINPANWILYK